MNKNIEQNNNKFLVKFFDDIYDLTKFLKKHPGGVNTLKGLNGNDMTKRFLNAPPHSNAALYLMKEYKIIKNNKELKEQNTINNINNNHSGIDDNQNDKICNDKMMNGNCINEFKSDEDLLKNSIKELTDESMEHLVDWSKPMIPQIHRIGNQYYEWVNKPVDRPLRLFKSDYLEISTKSPWWIVPLLWLPIIFYLSINDVLHEKLIQYPYQMNKVFTSILCFLYGIFMWTLVEYSLHRWIFHMKIPNKSSILCTFHFIIHGLHHKVPFDPYRLVFPPIPAIILALGFYPLVYLISINPQITMAGGLFGYVCYDMMHYYLHYGNPRIWQMHQMKRYHFQHHFAHHDQGFGISSPMWDRIFGTQIFLRKLKYMLEWKT